jgi:hypothetical protein
MRKLDAGVHVVSGTPGRVKDMMERQKLRTRHIKVGEGGCSRLYKSTQGNDLQCSA